MAKKKFLRKKIKGKVRIYKKNPALHSETKKGILVVVSFTLALLTFLSFFNIAGTWGEYFLKISKLLFGKGFFLISISFALAGIAILIPHFKISGSKKPVYKTIVIGITLFIFSILGVFHIFSSGVNEEAGGGYLGLVIGYPLITYLGFWASLIVLLSFLIISILIIFNIPLVPLKEEEKKEVSMVKPSIILDLENIEKKKISAKTGLWHKLKGKVNEEIMRGREEKKYLPDKEMDSLLGREDISEDKRSLTAIVLAGKKKTLKGDSFDFKMPSLDFLERDKGQPNSGDIKANINIIKRTLENFGIEVEMAEVNIGPTVTQYTLRPAQGIKLSKIVSLHSDLALALAAHPLRIEAPIPGKSLVGIEIPNRSMVVVRLRSLLERPIFQESSSGLTFALGRDVAGSPMFADLCQMPHLLVAGATGTGKTVALNNLVVSLLYNSSPNKLKLILIDPKRVELTAYESIPHLLSPVIVQPDKAIGALRWAVSEMERRFEVLQHAGKRDIRSHNMAIKPEDENEFLPYMVIVIDELADLMASNGREVESAIVRLAQMSRAVGIHLVVSTQRPSVEVITGLIKANITSRMAFQVASQVDSRTILDMAGAEKLLGNGDMLFLAGNSTKPRRVQGAFVSDKEVKLVTNYLRKAQEPDYKEEVVSDQRKNLRSGSFDLLEADDELYGEAKNVVIQAKKASASLLQRRLRVGYARAARLLDILEERGIVGPSDGAKPRNVFIDEGEEEI